MTYGGEVHPPSWLTSCPRFAAGMTLVASVIAVGAGMAAPQVRGAPPITRTAPPLRAGLNQGNGAESSLSWAGYAVSGGTFAKVGGTWNEPRVTCPSKPTQRAAFWVGIDGLSAPKDPTVEQVGTSSDCVAGKGQTYYAWFQMYPSPLVKLSVSKYQVLPGETFTAQVSGSGKTYVLTIDAAYAGVAVWSFSTKQTAKTTPQASSAEWITEAPCVGSPCTVLPLADFGSVSFSGISATGRASSTKGFTDTELTMTTKDSGTVKARPSALTSGGKAFSVTWLHS